MLFSILIANFNKSHFFKDCYNSIVSQTFFDWEVVIVDDCSTDNSVEIIKNLIGEDPRFRMYYNHKNRGCGFTKKRCASLASGEILGFLDPDDALKPDALQKMVRLHQEQKDVAVITSKYELVDLQMNTLNDGSHGEGIPAGESYLTFGRGALTHFATFKKNFYERSIGIDPVMKRAVDQDLYYKLEEQGRTLFLNEILYRYRIHSDSISNNENVYKARYWHFIAKEKAYKRRKKSNFLVKNFSNREFMNLKSEYFLGRYNHNNKNSSNFYFLIKSVLANPFHRFGYKMKNFFKVILKSI